MTALKFTHKIREAIESTKVAKSVSEAETELIILKTKIL
jgi:hypothetical protein